MIASLPLSFGHIILHLRDVAQVRMIITKLAKRCGFEAVAKYIPEADAPLLTSIRKEDNKKQRIKAGSSQVRGG